MNYVILHDGPKQASAFSVSLLAGCAGYATEAEFLEACDKNEDLLMDTSRQVDPVIREEGSSDEVAAQNLRQSLQAQGCDLVEGFSAYPRSAADKDFEQALRGAQAAVLVQASRLPGIRKAMTTAAVALATSVAIAFSGAAPEAHAAGIEQIAKDTLGGVLGAAVGSQFGKGRGRVAMQVLGAAAGVAAAEAMQRPQPTPAPSYGSYGSSGYPSMSQNNNQLGTVVGGTEILTPDKHEKMIALERNTLQTRDAFARSLADAARAEDDRVLDPHDRNAYQMSLRASTTTQTYNQNYAQAKNDFVNAYEYLARRGYDVHEFSFTYSVAQRQVTARDVSYRDMRGVSPAEPVAQPRAAILNANSL